VIMTKSESIAELIDNVPSDTDRYSYFQGVVKALHTFGIIDDLEFQLNYIKYKME
jgi:hypothetical protein